MGAGEVYRANLPMHCVYIVVHYIFVDIISQTIITTTNSRKDFSDDKIWSRLFSDCRYLSGKFSSFLGRFADFFE